MSVDLSNSTIKVFRDENDKYYTFLTGTIFNLNTNEGEGKFYSKRKIKFADNKEVKNKSKIMVLDGFVSPYRFKITNEKGEVKYISGEMYYIRDFELIEDGIEEKQKPFVFSQTEPQAKKEKQSKTDEKLNSFSFNEYSDVTPF